MNKSIPAMTTGRWLLLFGIGLAVYLAAARWITGPGYMDADYYYATGLQLQAGEGFQEPFLWNYLDDPAGIAHPSHLYWMPVSSILAAASMMLFGRAFAAAQIPFLLVAASLPVVTAYFSLRLTRDPNSALRAGLLAAFPGFFLPFLTTTDAFGIYAIVGGAALWKMGAAAGSTRQSDWLIAGLLIGFGNLIRADAALLLLAGLPLILSTKQHGLRSGIFLVAGFAIAVAPWWLRNLSETGALVNPGGTRVLWMLEYDDLFAFPAGRLTFERWWDAGLSAAIATRLGAAAVNLQRLIAENGLVFLGPFMLIGVVREWKQPVVRVTVSYLGLLLVAMSVVFPFVGPRGALFHSGTAAMPILWALTPVGIKRAVEWLGSRRGWDIAEASRVFGASAVAMAALVTIGLFVSRQILSGAGWNSSAAAYQRVAASLPDSEDTVVAVNNPPGFFIQCQCAAVSIPNGGPSTLRQIVERYDVSWVVLEANHPAGLDGLYGTPDLVDWLSLVRSVEDSDGASILIFEVDAS